MSGADEPFPFAEVAAKAEVAGGLPRETRHISSAFAALGVGRVPVFATRQEDVHGERIVFGPHRFQDRFGFLNRLAQPGQSVLKLICAHYVQLNRVAR